MAKLRYLNRSGIQMRAELVQAVTACSPVGQLVQFGLVLGALDRYCDLRCNRAKTSRKEPQDHLVRAFRHGFLDELLEYG